MKVIDATRDDTRVLFRSLPALDIQEAQEKLLAFEKSLEETFQRLQRFENKANSIFRSLMGQAKRSSLFFEKQDLYEVYLAGEKEIYPLSYVNATLRKNKDKYDLWIDEERGEVRVNKEEISAGTNIHKLLVFIAKNVGRFCPRSEFFEAVWDFKGPSENPSHKTALQQMFSRYIYKYGGGILNKFINGKKHGYRIQDNLRSCVVFKKTPLQEPH